MSFSLLCVALLSACRPASAAQFETVNVGWVNGDVRLAGTIYLPKGAGPHPAAIFIHGSGNMGRGPERGNDVLRAHATELAARGVAVLLYDKRGVGASTGAWRTAGFDELAADAAGGLALLAKDPRIDPARLGIIGLSQGSWISLKTIERFPQVRFIAWVTGAAVTPARQELHVVGSRLKQAGASAADLSAAERLLLQALEAYRSNTGWDTLALAAASAEKESWFKPSGIGIAAPADAWWKWYASFMDYDPRPALLRLEAPLFAAFAGDDQLIDSQESMAALAAVRSGGRDIDTRVYPGLKHGFRNSSGSLAIPADYWADLAAFLQRIGITKSPVYH